MATREEIGNLVVSATLDAQQFQSGVSSLKRELAVAKSEFKAASATLGSFGSDLDKLKLREDALAEQMQIQQRIVDTLNASYENSVKVKGEDASQTQNLEIKLNNAKAALAGMADELKTVNLNLEKLEEGEVTAAEEQRSFAASVAETKEGLEGTHAAMVGFVGIMAGGMISEWTEGAEKMAINLQKLQAESGDSQQELERLAVVSSGAGVSMDQLANMVGRLDMRIGTATTPSKTFMQSLQALGISAEEFSKAPVPEQAQMIAEAMDKSNLPTKQLDSALQGLGITTSDLGKNASQNLKVIQDSLTETATNSSTLGRALESAGINMQQFVSADTEGKIQMLGKYMEEAHNKTQATALIMQVFGRSGADMLPLIENFSELDEYAKQLKMPVMDTHEIQLAAEKTKMLQTAMQMLIDSAMAKLLPIVDNLGKGFYQLFTEISNPIQAFKDFEKDLGPVATAITSVVMALAAMKIIESVTGTVKAFIETVTSAGKFLAIMGAEEEAVTIKTIALTVAQGVQTAATKAAEMAQIAFNAVMDANPIALVTIAIAALVAGIVLMINHWKEVTSTVQKVWGGVTRATQNAWNAMVGWFNGLWSSISSFFAKWGPDILAVVAPFIGVPLLIFQHWQQIGAWLQGVWNNVKASVEAFVNGIVDAFSWMYNHNYYFKELVDFIKNAWTTIQNDTTAAWNAVTSFLSNAWNGIKSVATTVWNTIAKVFTDVWKAIKTAADAFWNAEVKGWELIWTGVVKAVDLIFTPVDKFFTKLWDGISQTATSMWSGIRSTMSGLWNGIIGDAENIFNGLGDFFKGLWTEAEQWGANLIHMMAQGILNAAHEVEQAVQSVASKVSSFLGFHSPTKEGPGSDADTWAPNLVKMFASGLTEGIPTVQTALTKVLLPPINSGTMFGIGQAGMQTTAGAITNGGHTFNLKFYGGSNGDMKSQIIQVFQNEIVPQITQASRAMGGA